MGGREVFNLLLQVYRKNDYASWKGILEKVKKRKMLYFEEKPLEFKFPWAFFDMGVSKEYLKKEYIAAKKGLITCPCFPGCKRCGICAGEKVEFLWT